MSEVNGSLGTRSALLELPREVLERVLGSLSGKERLDFALISRECRAVVMNPRLWMDHQNFIISRGPNSGEVRICNRATRADRVQNMMERLFLLVKPIQLDVRTNPSFFWICDTDMDNFMALVVSALKIRTRLTGHSPAGGVQSSVARAAVVSGLPRSTCFTQSVTPSALEQSTTKDKGETEVAVVGQSSVELLTSADDKADVEVPAADLLTSAEDNDAKLLLSVEQSSALLVPSAEDSHSGVQSSSSVRESEHHSLVDVSISAHASAATLAAVPEGCARVPPVGSTFGLTARNQRGASTPPVSAARVTAMRTPLKRSQSGRNLAFTLGECMTPTTTKDFGKLTATEGNASVALWAGRQLPPGEPVRLVLSECVGVPLLEALEAAPTTTHLTLIRAQLPDIQKLNFNGAMGATQYDGRRMCDAIAAMPLRSVHVSMSCRWKWQLASVDVLHAFRDKRIENFWLEDVTGLDVPTLATILNSQQTEKEWALVLFGLESVFGSVTPYSALWDGNGPKIRRSRLAKLSALQLTVSQEPSDVLRVLAYTKTLRYLGIFAHPAVYRFQAEDLQKILSEVWAYMERTDMKFFQVNIDWMPEGDLANAILALPCVDSLKEYNFNIGFRVQFLSGRWCELEFWSRPEVLPGEDDAGRENPWCDRPYD